MVVNDSKAPCPAPGLAVEDEAAGAAAKLEGNGHDVERAALVGRALDETFEAEGKRFADDAGKLSHLDPQQGKPGAAVAGQLFFGNGEHVFGNGEFVHDPALYASPRHP